jgi:hypothetical protein
MLFAVLQFSRILLLVFGVFVDSDQQLLSDLKLLLFLGGYIWFYGFSMQETILVNMVYVHCCRVSN